MAFATAQAPSIRKSRRAAEPAAVQNRGDEARRKILETAVEEFAAHGYTGASTRSITTRAGVNLGALNYYFDGKPKLYRAVLDHIAEQADAIIRPMCQAAFETLRDPKADETALREAIFAFLDQLLDVILHSTKVKWEPTWSLLMSRAELEPPEDESLPFKETYATLLRPLAELTARILGRPTVDEECRMTAVLFYGQVSAFRTLRIGGLPIMDWKRITSERRESIRQAIRDGVNALLDLKAASKNVPAAPRPRRAGSG